MLHLTPSQQRAYNKKKIENARELFEQGSSMESNDQPTVESNREKSEEIVPERIEKPPNTAIATYIGRGIAWISAGLLALLYFKWRGPLTPLENLDITAGQTRLEKNPGTETIIEEKNKVDAQPVTQSRLLTTKIGKDRKSHIIIGQKHIS